MPAAAVAPDLDDVSPLKPTSPLVARIIEGILKFHDILVGHEFYTYQYVFAYRIIEALLTDDDVGDQIGSTITGLWSRQSGKTSCVAELIATLAIMLPVMAHRLPRLEFLHKFKEGLRVGIFAPIDAQAKLSYDKMRDILHSDRAQELMANDDIDVRLVKSRGDQLAFSNMSAVVAKTASPDSNVEGVSGLHIILIDEAQGVDAFKVEKEIEPMRAATNGVMVNIGTASISRGGFRNNIEANIASFRIGRSPRNHFEFPYDQVIAVKRQAYQRTGHKFHLAYEKYVAGKIRQHGKHSPAFRMNFMLKWQEARLDAVSDVSIAASKDMSRVLNVPTREEVRPGLVRVAGIDIGKGASDPTVVTIDEIDLDSPIVVKDEKTGDELNLYDHHLIAFSEYEGNFEDLPDGTNGQYSDIVDFLRQWNVRRVTIDATSMGDPIYQRFQVLASDIDWEPYRYTDSTKSDLFTYYLQEFEGQRVHVPSGGNSKKTTQWQSFYREHKTLQKVTIGNSNRIRVSAPQTTLKRKLPGEVEFHDDYPNSAALAVWCTRSEIAVEIHVDSQSSGAYTGQQQRYGRSSTASRYAQR